jgi:hypothetical protein
METTLTPNATTIRILSDKLAHAEKIKNDIDILATEMKFAYDDLVPECPVMPADGELLTAPRLSMTINDAKWTMERHASKHRGTGAITLRVTGTVNGKSFDDLSVEIRNGFMYEDNSIVGRKLNGMVAGYSNANLSDTAKHKIGNTVAAYVVDAGITPEWLDEIGTLLATISKVSEFVTEMKTYRDAGPARESIVALADSWGIK